jgi:hypothetical protein
MDAPKLRQQGITTRGGTARADWAERGAHAGRLPSYLPTPFPLCIECILPRRVSRRSGQDPAHVSL